MFLELHIIQNFAPSCLNRDDTGAPKECVFGGYRRARISSQCLKRAVREYFLRNSDRLEFPGRIGTRTRYLGKKISEALVKGGKDRASSAAISNYIVARTGMKGRNGRTNTLLFLGEDELLRLRDAILKSWNELKVLTREKRNRDDASTTSAAGGCSKIPAEVKEILNTLKSGTESVDIALFGRMVAEMPEYGMNVEAACQVAHAISTNRVSMEADFFTAVDDFKPENDTGSGMMGFLEYNSSCFYRYALIDYGQLKNNLKGDTALAKAGAIAFTEAFIKSLPSGRQSSTAAKNPPDFIKAVLRSGGQPVSAANAFLEPARPSGRVTVVQDSIAKFMDYSESLAGMYGLTGDTADEIVCSTIELKDCPGKTVSELLDRVRGGLE